MNFSVIWVWPRCGVLIHTVAWKGFNKVVNRKSRTPTGSMAVFSPYKLFAVAVIICIFCWLASQSPRLYVLSSFENQKCKFVSYRRQNTLTLVLTARLFTWMFDIICFHWVMRILLTSQMCMFFSWKSLFSMNEFRFRIVLKFNRGTLTYHLIFSVLKRMYVFFVESLSRNSSICRDVCPLICMFNPSALNVFNEIFF